MDEREEILGSLLGELARLLMDDRFAEFPKAIEALTAVKRWAEEVSIQGEA